MAVQYVTTTQEQVDDSTVCHYHTGKRLMAVQYVTTTQGTG